MQVVQLAEEAARARSANVLMLEQLQEAPARTRQRADGAGTAEADLLHVSGTAACVVIGEAAKSASFPLFYSFCLWQAQRTGLLFP